MGKTIEPCIHEVPATKRYPAGFHVRKEVRDQWGSRRQVSQIFRPLDDSDEAREAALEEARSFIRQVEREKRTGKVYRRFDERTESSKRQNISGYGIARHEYPEEEHAEINRELQETHEREMREIGHQNSMGRQTFRQFIGDHLSWYEENTSKSNFQKKRAAWKAVQKYTKETGSHLLTRKISEIRPSDIDNFVSWLEGRKKKKSDVPYYSTSSVKGYFSAVRSFFKHWSAEEGKPNPASPELLKTDTARLKGRQKTEKVPDDEQLRKLKEGFQKAIDDSGSRYRHLRIIVRFIHRVLMGTGMRISEALYLTTDHLDVDEMTITIDGAVVDGEPGLTKTGERKGSREAGTRVIPLSKSVLETIREWIELREELKYPDADEVGTIFCRRDGSYYTDQQIRSYYNHACAKAKMKGNITPHQIRHYHNDWLRKAGLSSEIREAILGHADSETNAGYTSVKALEGREVMESIG